MDDSMAALAATCSHCDHPGCDVVIIKGFGGGSGYHARCIDLAAFAGRGVGAPSTSSERPRRQKQQLQRAEEQATGLVMVPLSFAEIDHAQKLSCYNGKSGDNHLVAQAGKRMNFELRGGSSTSRETSFYDPAAPRTGKWSEEEIAFRDAMVPHFVEGSLPLQEGLKLIEFLSVMLKAKPSRLTKKMKHAKLSTRTYNLDDGFIRSAERARELSRLELAFVNSISDPVERSEIKFHMQREWRDRLAERLTQLSIPFDAEGWLKSVDVMDRRIALAKSRSRMVKRRYMMGKAIEEDTSSPTPGIFIDSSVGENSGAARHQEDVDLELLANSLEADDSDDAVLRALCSGTASDKAVKNGVAAGSSVHEVSTDSSQSRGSASAGSGSDSRPSSADLSAAPPPPQPPLFRSALFPSLGSAEGPNFRFAAPFLAKITAYVERNRIPFEHADVWVPSMSDPVLDPTGATAPEPSLLGSGSGNAAGPGDRLCFAGSASVAVQVLPEEAGAPPALASAPSAFGHSRGQGMSGGDYNGPKTIPLSSDEIYHLSLFGSYSEKFSFSSGCGLPGRVYQSAIPAWEQFIANAPSHLFERRGGAMQFGIKTALGLPIVSPNVGRLVVVLYSKHNREKDDGLVARMVRDFRSLNPSPRWKLMVDMGNVSAANQVNFSRQAPSNGGSDGTSSSVMTTWLSEKNVQISNLISLLGENMPSNPSSPLGQQLHNIMSLRLILLRMNRDPQDEQIVDSILTLFESYAKAGRSRSDMTLMLARDFAFHSSIQHRRHQPQHKPQQQAMQPHIEQCQPPMLMRQPQYQCQVSLPSVRHLSSSEAAMPQHQGLVSCRLDHMNHGQPQVDPACATAVSTKDTVANDGMSLPGLFPPPNSRGPDSRASPRSASARLEGMQHCASLAPPAAEPPSSVPSPL